MDKVGDRRKMRVDILLAYALFLLMWGIGQALALLTGEVVIFFSLLFYMVVYIGISGIAVPLYLARKYRLALHASARGWQTVLGILVLLAVLAASVFSPDGLPVLRADPPSLQGVIKYLLLFIPMALGISLYSFFLIPRLIAPDGGGKLPVTLLSMLASALSLGISFWVDQLFRFEEVVIVMLFLGLFFGLGALLTRSLVLAYISFLPAILVNTLAEAKYFALPLAPLVIGFIFACVLVIWHIKRSNDEAKKSSVTPKTA